MVDCCSDVKWFVEWLVVCLGKEGVDVKGGNGWGGGS